MGFYDEIAKNIPWEIANSTDAYLKVVGGKLQLPNVKWLQYHLRYIDKIIETIYAFERGELRGISYDVSIIKKHIIDNPEEGINFLRTLSKEYSEFSIDIESSNLSTDRTKNKVLCIGLAYKDNEGVCFLRPCFLNEDFRNEFQKFALNKDLRFIFQNGVFDRSRTLIIENIELKIDDDTLLQHYCGINEHKGTHGLKEMAQLYLGFPDWEAPLKKVKQEYCRAHKIKQADFLYDYYDQRTLGEYNVIDCCATFQLKHLFDKLMRDSSKNIYRKLIEAAPYYADMIVRGMKVDLDYWEQLKDELTNIRDQLLKELATFMPGVKVTSPVQLKKWLIKHFPYDLIDSTNAKALKQLAQKHPDEQVLKTILAYRKNDKYLKTYVIGIKKRMDQDQVIHCEYNLHGTESGRLSSKNPNMQNIPRNALIKKLFIAREGYELLQLDYSQLELRVLAYISEDDTLMQCYIDGRDLHSEMQQKIFKDKCDLHDKDQRMAAKIVNFGIPYGRTDAGVAEQLNISKFEARRYLENWFAGAPKVKNYIKKCHDMALADPQEVYYTVFGRARHYFVTNESAYHVKNQSANFPISSTANDLTIHALVLIGLYIKENHFDAYLVNTVHDSIILEVRSKDAKVIAEKCQEIMAEVPKMYLPNLRLPFRADVEIGHSWGEIKEPDWDEYEDEEDEEDED